MYCDSPGFSALRQMHPMDHSCCSRPPQRVRTLTICFTSPPPPLLPHLKRTHNRTSLRTKSPTPRDNSRYITPCHSPPLIAAELSPLPRSTIIPRQQMERHQRRCHSSSQNIGTRPSHSQRASQNSRGNCITHSCRVMMFCASHCCGCVVVAMILFLRLLSIARAKWKFFLRERAHTALPPFPTCASKWTTRRGVLDVTLLFQIDSFNSRTTPQIMQQP
jgi:hypothetical protein